MHDDSFPIVAPKDELIFEEVDKSPLIFALAQELSIVVKGDLRWRVFPWLVAFAGGGIFVDFVEVIGRTVEQVRGAKMLYEVIR